MRSLSIPTPDDENRNIIPTSQIYEFYEVVKHANEIPSIQFIFGSKGCGKSTALKYYIEHEKNNRWLSIYQELSITLSYSTTIKSIKNELKAKIDIDLLSLDRSNIDFNKLFISTIFIDNGELLTEELFEIFLKLHHNLSTPLIILSNQITINNSRVTKLSGEEALLRPHRYWGNLAFYEFQRKVIPSLLSSAELDYQTQDSGFNQECLREVFKSTNGNFQSIINIISKIGSSIETMNDLQNSDQIYLEDDHRYESAKKHIAQKVTHNKYLATSDHLEEIYLKDLYAGTFPKEAFPALAVERHFSHPDNLPNLMFLHRILKTALSLNPEFDLAYGIDFEDSFAHYVKSTGEFREKPMPQHEYWINYYSKLGVNHLLNRIEVSDQIWVIDHAICPGCGKQILTLSEDGRVCHFEIGENNVLSTIYSLLLKKLNLNIRWQQSKYIMTTPKSLHWSEQTPDVNPIFNLSNHGTLFEYKKEATCEILNDWLSLHICCTNNNLSTLELIFNQFIKHQMVTTNPLELENELFAKHKTMIAKFGKVRADVFIPEFAEMLKKENIELLNPEMISTKNFKFRPTHDISPYTNSEVTIKSGVDIIGEPYGYIYSQGRRVSGLEVMSPREVTSLSSR